MATLEEHLQTDELLAHWRYSPEEWQRQCRRNYERLSADLRRVHLALTGIFLIVFLLFVFTEPRNLTWCLTTFILLMAAAGLVAFLRPRRSLSRCLQASPEAHIFPQAVFLGAGRREWGGDTGVLLQGVRLLPGPPPHLLFVTAYRLYRSATVETLEVPVPPDERLVAWKIVERLGNPPGNRDSQTGTGP